MQINFLTSKNSSMKSLFSFTAASVALCLSLVACSSKQSIDPNADKTAASATVNPDARFAARLVGAQYSQPIQIDTANRMISSYLESVGYPQVDTAVRSLAFDADTLRSYLSNPSITTLRFFLGHQLSYLNGGSDRFGKDIGMRPGALTIIAVGINDNGQIVRNSSNGVYEHAMPCPYSCGGNAIDAYLH
jgi:hypothetical protein